MACNDSIIVHVSGSYIWEQQGGQHEMHELLGDAEKHVCNNIVKNESLSFSMALSHCDQYIEEFKVAIQRI